MERPASVPADARWNAEDARWEQSKIEDGKWVGPMRAFRADGTLLFEARFAGGRLQGSLKKFHRDGSVAREATYDGGTLTGTLVVTRGEDDLYPWEDERSRRAELRFDDEGQLVSRFEQDDRGREITPGAALDERAGSVDGIFSEHGPEGFLASGAFAKTIAAVGLPPAARAADRVAKDDGLLLPHAPLHRRPMTAARFEELYGVPMPSELAAWLAAASAAPAIMEIVPLAEIDVVADRNLVEAAILEYQAAPGRTSFWSGIVSASLPFAKLRSDDLMLGLLEGANNLPNAVYPFDAARADLQTPITRSLDDFAYLLALAAAHETGALSRAKLTPAFEKLRGRVDPPESFADLVACALPEGTGGEIDGDPTTDHSEGFAFRRANSMPRGHYVRGAWLSALLRGHVEEAYTLFLPAWDAPTDQVALERLIDLSKARVSTGVYALFRNWVFQRQNLPELIEGCKASPSRLVADAAALVAELASGRNTLGAVDDLEAVRAAFVAMKPLEKVEATEEEDGDEDEDEDEGDEEEEESDDEDE